MRLLDSISKLVLKGHFATMRCVKFRVSYRILAADVEQLFSPLRGQLYSIYFFSGDLPTVLPLKLISYFYFQLSIYEVFHNQEPY